MTEPTPRTATSLFGHEEAEAQLIAETRAGRLAHGIILSGPKGIGKATLAYRFARFLFSPSPLVGSTRVSVEGRGEGVSYEKVSSKRDPLSLTLPHKGGGEIEDPVFRRIASGAHADLLVVEPLYDEKKEEFARDISVDQARGVAQFLSLTPAEGSWRVVIIDSADALNANAANAILKILEEPPAQAVLLLVAHNPGALLATIRSRCRMLKLKPLAADDFARAGALLLPDVPQDRIAALGQISGYAPGLACELERQGALDLYQEILDLLSNLPSLDALKLHAFSDRVTASRLHENWQLLMRLMLFLFERTARQAAGAGFDLVLPDERSVAETLANLHPPHVWATKWQRTLDQFLLAQARHLDYRQMIIAFFHAVAGGEGLSLGTAA